MKLYIFTDGPQWYWWMSHEGAPDWKKSDHPSGLWFGLKQRPCGEWWSIENTMMHLRRLIV